MNQRYWNTDDWDNEPCGTAILDWIKWAEGIRAMNALLKG